MSWHGISDVREGHSSWRNSVTKLILSIVFRKFIPKPGRLAVRHLTEHLPAKIFVATSVSDGKWTDWYRVWAVTT